MRWLATERHLKRPALALVVLLCVALAGCAGGSSRQPWIKTSQLATLPGSTVQVDRKSVV